ncbi:hypothetical protein ACO0E1_00930 [Curtobacterium sp. RRHDQ66]|uniref:hypothetical protein n=1 Tax=Curtobacterium guangdongense TaxID=3413380 RepID=UPI003BF226AF
MLAIALRIPAVVFAGLAVWSISTADGDSGWIALGVVSAVLALSPVVGGLMATEAARRRSLDVAVARKDAWEREHSDQKD